MKFFLLTSLLATAKAFISPAAFMSTRTASASTYLSSTSSSTKVPFDFDPTSGDTPALIKNNADGVWVPQRSRPRRNRKSAAIRGMVREVSECFQRGSWDVDVSKVDNSVRNLLLTT